MNMRFWYCQRARKSALGSRNSSREKRSFRESGAAYQTRSWRGRPERWVTRSRGVIRSLAMGSFSLNEGR